MSTNDAFITNGAGCIRSDSDTTRDLHKRIKSARIACTRGKELSDDGNTVFVDDLEGRLDDVRVKDCELESVCDDENVDDAVGVMESVVI